MSRFVPYLADEAIERDAASLIAEYEHARGVMIEPPIPVEDIVEKHLKLRIEFDDMHVRHNVPRPKNGQPDILGAIYGDGSIFIDESLDPEENPSKEGRYRFTLAHEGGGHWRLHQHLFVQDPPQNSFFDEVSGPKFLCRSSQAKRREEWQADYYASCLLMPRALIYLEWRKRFNSDRPFVFDEHSHNPHWRAPRSTWTPFQIAATDAIYSLAGLSQEPDHSFAFDKISREFAAVFRVSIAAMRIRLEGLGLLLAHRPRQESLEIGL